MNPASYEFDAVIRKVPDIDGHMWKFPLMCGVYSAKAG